MNMHPGFAKLLRSTAAVALLSLCGTGFAATQTLSFSATVGAGPFANTVGTGEFSFDNTAITGTGTEILDPSTSLAISFTIFGQPFTEMNDVDFTGLPGGFPTLTFVDGTPVQIDYLLVDGVNGVDFTDPTIARVSIGFNLTPGTNVRFETDAEVFLAAVPEPVTALLVGLGLVGIGAGRGLKRRS